MERRDGKTPALRGIGQESAPWVVSPNPDDLWSPPRLILPDFLQVVEVIFGCRNPVFEHKLLDAEDIRNWSRRHEERTIARRRIAGVDGRLGNGRPEFCSEFSESLQAA